MELASSLDLSLGLDFWKRLGPFRSFYYHMLARREELLRLSAPLKTSRQLTQLAAAPRRVDEPYQFAVLGDAEPGRFWIWRKLFNRPGVFSRQIRALQDHPVDFTMQLGDMVSRGIARNYLRFLRELRKAGPGRPYLTVIGNHDRFDPHLRSNSKLYRSCFGSTNYFFDRGGARFVVIDTSAKHLRQSQLRWLDLALRTSLRKVVFTHIPPAPLKAWTDFPGVRPGVGGFHRGATEFMEILSRRRVDRVYLGHIHGFGVQDYKGVRYVLSGGGGSPLFPSKVRDRFYHYILVTVSSGGVTETVCSLDGGRFGIPSGKVLLSF